MSRKLRNLLLKYGISLLLGAGLAWLTLTLHGFSETTALSERYRLLSDAFLIPGTLLLMLGLLVAVSNAGSFIGLGYVLRYTIARLIPGGRVKKEERYYDYRKRRMEQKKARGYSFLIVSGIILIAVSVFFLVRFYQVWER